MNEAHCWELDRLRHRLQAEEFGHQNFPLIQAVEAAIAALHGSEAGPRRLKHEDIELVEPYLHHLREAAEGWAFEDVDIEQETARRAVIVMSRNVLCLIDELRKLRAEAGPQEAREDVKPHVAMLTAEGYWEIFDELTRRYPELGVCSGLKSAVFQALKLASSGSEAGVSARVLEWQPIETAPTDGTNVLLWWPFWCKGRPTIGFFGFRGIGQWFAPEVLEGDGDPPTHWMPLPSPPVRAALGVSPAAPEKELI